VQQQQKEEFFSSYNSVNFEIRQPLFSAPFASRVVPCFFLKEELIENTQELALTNSTLINDRPFFL
jgi:hypothetical protein